jgi:hypothetical protein
MLTLAVTISKKILIKDTRVMQHIGYREVQAAAVVALDVTSCCASYNVAVTVGMMRVMIV